MRWVPRLDKMSQLIVDKHGYVATVLLRYDFNNQGALVLIYDNRMIIVLEGPWDEMFQALRDLPQQDAEIFLMESLL